MVDRLFRRIIGCCDGTMGTRDERRRLRGGITTGTGLADCSGSDFMVTSNTNSHCSGSDLMGAIITGTHCSVEASLGASITRR